MRDPDKLETPFSSQDAWNMWQPLWSNEIGVPNSKSNTVASRYNEDSVIANVWKPGRITVYVEKKTRYNEISAVTNRFWRSQRTIYPALTNISSCRSQSVTTIWWYKWLSSQTRLLLVFKALLHLNAAVHGQACRLFCGVYTCIPLFSLGQLGYPALKNIFVVNLLIRYNGVFAITKTLL